MTGNWILYLSLFIVMFSCICSLRSFMAGGERLLRLFSFFLAFTFLGEIFGIMWGAKLYHLTSLGRNNQWFYNIFHLFGYTFLMYFFYNILDQKRIKKVISRLVIAFLVFAMSNLLFFQGLMQLNTYTEVLACFIMVFMSIAYYYQLLDAPQLTQLSRDPFFWISTGVLIYHLGSVMGIFLINVMNIISSEKAKGIHTIIMFSSVAMYLNFSIAYLCRRTK